MTSQELNHTINILNKTKIIKTIKIMKYLDQKVNLFTNQILLKVIVYKQKILKVFKLIKELSLNQIPLFLKE